MLFLVLLQGAGAARDGGIRDRREAAGSEAGHVGRIAVGRVAQQSIQPVDSLI
jgi:hypothetical protein